MDKQRNPLDLRAGVRLTVLLGCVGLAATRLGLLAHELVGHGGVALAVGGRVTDVRLFWFAGGWIRYTGVPSASAQLAIAMAGIAVELACGAALWLALRRARSLGARIARASGAAFVVHASWYLATGAWHGFGDGALLYEQLGDARAAVAIPAAIVTCLAAYAGARGVFGALAGAARPAALVAAIVVAAAVNAGLAVGELRVRRDPTYAATMAPARDREVARELARWQAEQARRGTVVAADDAARERARLEREHQPFPFAWLLAGATLAAIVLGARRSARGDAGPPARALVARAAVIAAIAVAAVIALGTIG